MKKESHTNVFLANVREVSLLSKLSCIVLLQACKSTQGLCITMDFVKDEVSVTILQETQGNASDMKEVLFLKCTHAGVSNQ